MSEELRLSVSKVKTFLSCKKKFKFTYIDKLPQQEFDFYTFGKFCHKVLENFHNTYINGSLEPYNKIMSQAFKDALIEFKLTREIKKECWDLINKYLMIVTKNKKENKSSNIISCEKNFNFSIDKNIKLNGMIDRIQIDDDNVIHVGDYKTTKNKKYLKDDDFQLLTYAYYILSNEDTSAKKIRGSYILLRHDFENLTFEFNQSQILKIKDLYIKYGSQILSEKNYDPNANRLCEYCSFLNVCDEGKKFNHIFSGETNW
jgi:putative RecB family exonuclease